MKRSAVISPCGTYRHTLERMWDDTIPMLGFVMLNPSTADADLDDPTSTKCMHFARQEGYGGIQISNLYAYRATDPKQLQGLDDPLGYGYFEHLENMLSFVDAVVVAWGVNAKGRTAHVKSVMRHISDYHDPIYCLGTTKDGFPKHPCYLAHKTRIEEFVHG